MWYDHWGIRRKTFRIDSTSFKSKSDKLGSRNDFMCERNDLKTIDSVVQNFKCFFVRNLATAKLLEYSSKRGRIKGRGILSIFFDY